ncbi:MAG: DUF7713 domain-containing protein [Actinomycetes bacterium]
MVVGRVVREVSGCRVCGGGPADAWLGECGPLRDRCFDDRLVASTGWARLPSVPGPVWLTGADGRRHRMRYRIWRAPTGVVVELREEGLAGGEDGFEFGVLGGHDADVSMLVAAVRARAEDEMSRCYLEPDPCGAGWTMAGEEVVGRLEWNPDGGPYRVVVDGRSLSWEEFGLTLGSFEGGRFRLVIEDRSTDVRSEAEPLGPWGEV